MPTILPLWRAATAAVIAASAAFALQGPTYTSVMNSAVIRDASGYVYAFGITDDPNFPVTPGAFQTQFIKVACGYYKGQISQYRVHGYVAKLSPSGDLLWCTYLEGSGDDQVWSAALDSKGDIWVTGTTQSPDFPLTPNALQSQPAYTFLSELSPDGSQLLYSTFIGGSYEQSMSLNIDSQDKIYILGYSESPTFAATPGAYNSQPAGCSAQLPPYCMYEPYARKFDPAANQMVYSTLIGPVEEPENNLYTDALSTVDENGIFYIAGYTHRPDYPTTPGAYSNPAGQINVFVTAINPSGTGLVFSTVIGGSGDNFPTALARDGPGNIYVAGTCGGDQLPWYGAYQATSPDFPVTPDAMQSFWGPAFLMKLSPDGSSLLYSTFIGRAGLGTPLYLTEPQQMRLDANGNVQMLIFSEQSDIPLSGDGYSPCYPEIVQLDTNTLQHWTYLRFSSDLSQIQYATAIPTPYLSPSYLTYVSPYFFDTSGNFYETASPIPALRETPAPRETGTGGKYFDIVNLSQAPNSGPVCIAESVTHTMASAAPGLLMSVYGPGIGPTQPTWAVPVAGVVPGELAGVQVLFDNLPAPILYADPNEIDVVVPFAAPTSGTTTISVLRDGAPQGTLTDDAVEVNPFLFSVNGTGYGASGWYPDGTPNTSDNPAAVGDHLTFYGTGVGAVFAPLPDGTIPTSAHPSRSFSGTAPCSTTQTYAGDAPGQVEGIVQMNSQVACLLGDGVEAAMGLSLNGSAYFSSRSNNVVFYAAPGGSASDRPAPEPSRQGQICPGTNRGSLRPKCHTWGTNPRQPQ